MHMDINEIFAKCYLVLSQHIFNNKTENSIEIPLLFYALCDVRNKLYYSYKNAPVACCCFTIFLN